MISIWTVLAFFTFLTFYSLNNQFNIQENTKQHNQLLHIVVILIVLICCRPEGLYSTMYTPNANHIYNFTLKKICAIYKI